MSKRLSISVVALCAISASAFGTIDYTSMPGVPYSVLGGGDAFYEVGYYGDAFSFISLAVQGELTGFDVDVFDLDSSGPQNFTLSLYQDNGNSLGSLLGSWVGTTNGTADVYVPASGVHIDTYTSYYLAATDGPIGDQSYQGLLAWAYSATLTQGSTIGIVRPNQYGEVPAQIPNTAFQVNVATTPAPAAIAPFLLGLARLRRRRNPTRA